ncbi:MAG: DMT family transporter [Pseudomonadota bacterium]
MPFRTLLHSHPRLTAIALLILAMACFQVGAALAKQLFALFGAQGMAAQRLFFSAVLMSIVFRPWRGALTRREIGLVICYGAAMGMMNLFFYIALKTIPLGIAVAIEFTGPLAVALLASRNMLDFFWALLATVGIALLLPIHGGSALDPLGLFYISIAAVCWALYIIFGQKAGRTVKGARPVALGIIVAACLVSPVGASHIDFNMFTPVILLTGILVGALSSALPYSLEMIALQRLPAKTFGILMSLEPALAALSGLILLQEILNVQQWTAISFIILASAGSAAFSKNPPATEPVN